MKKIFRLRNILVGLVLLVLLAGFWDCGYTLVTKPGWFKSSKRVSYFKDKLRAKIYLDGFGKLFGAEPSSCDSLDIEDMIAEHESNQNLEKMVYAAHSCETPNFLMSKGSCSRLCAGAKEALVFKIARSCGQHAVSILETIQRDPNLGFDAGLAFGLHQAIQEAKKTEQQYLESIR